MSRGHSSNGHLIDGLATRLSALDGFRAIETLGLSGTHLTTIRSSDSSVRYAEFIMDGFGDRVLAGNAGCRKTTVGVACLFAAAVIWSVVTFSQTAFSDELKARADDGSLGLGFKSGYAEVNGIKLHYVEGGQGQRTVVLIPGWPQTWYAWRKIMPELGKNYRVIAIDIRGMGDSSRPDDGYDTKTASQDVSALMDKLGISRYSVIGHDIGMWIAYPLAARHGEAIDKLVMTEATIPGVTPWPPMLLPPQANAGMTQFMFNQLRDLPEFLVTGAKKLICVG